MAAGIKRYDLHVHGSGAIENIYASSVKAAIEDATDWLRFERRYAWLTDRKGRIVHKWNRSQESNPASALPVGRMVTVRAIRRKNGRVDLYRA